MAGFTTPPAGGAQIVFEGSATAVSAQRRRTQMREAQRKHRRRRRELLEELETRCVTLDEEVRHCKHVKSELFRMMQGALSHLNTVKLYGAAADTIQAATNILYAGLAQHDALPEENHISASASPLLQPLDFDSKPQITLSAPSGHGYSRSIDSYATFAMSPSPALAHVELVPPTPQMMLTPAFSQADSSFSLAQEYCIPTSEPATTFEPYMYSQGMYSPAMSAADFTLFAYDSPSPAPMDAHLHAIPPLDLAFTPTSTAESDVSSYSSCGMTSFAPSMHLREHSF